MGAPPRPIGFPAARGDRRRAGVSRSARCGFSLLEVVLALAILLLALVVIGELVNMGARNSLLARRMTKAVLLAESKQSETIAGSQVSQAETSGSFPDDPDWQYTVSAEPAGVDGLLRVTTTVTYAGTGSDQEVSVGLTRLTTDPAWRQTLAASQPTSGQGTGGSNGTSSSP